MGKEQYDEIAEEYSNMLVPTKKYILVPTFKKLVGKVQNKSVLDLACGDGFFTRIIAGLNPSELIGIDFSPKLIEKANEKENQNPLGIKYSVGDVLLLELDKKFDLISAVFLLNYSQTEDELLTMCKNIYNHLKPREKFCTITTNPILRPMENFEYGRRYTSAEGGKYFKDGDQIRMEFREEGKKPFKFVFYYWSKKTYDKCLRNAGFKSIKWVKPIISQEGIKKYGKSYWDKFQKNSAIIGIICEK